MLPNILTQLGPGGLSHLKRLADDVQANCKAAEEEEDVPSLVGDFEEASKTEVEKITKKTEEIDVS